MVHQYHLEEFIGLGSSKSYLMKSLVQNDWAISNLVNCSPKPPRIALLHKGDLYFCKAEVTNRQPVAKSSPQLCDPHRMWKTIERTFISEGI